MESPSDALEELLSRISNIQKDAEILNRNLDQFDKQLDELEKLIKEAKE